METVKTKICKDCKLELPESEFYIANKEYGCLFTECKKCHHKRTNKWRSSNPKRVSKSRRILRLNTPHQLNWATDAYRQHAKKGLKLNFTIKNLYEKALRTKICIYCNKELDWSSGKKILQRLSASFDNKDMKQELNIEDVDIICVDCNSCKQDRTFQEFVDYCTFIKNKFEGISL